MSNFVEKEIKTNLICKLQNCRSFLLFFFSHEFGILKHKISQWAGIGKKANLSSSCNFTQKKKYPKKNPLIVIIIFLKKKEQ